MSDLFDACKVPCEPSKILTRHRVPFRADFGWIFGILPSLVVNYEVSVSADIGCIHRFSRKKTKKMRRKIYKMPCFRAKNIGLLGHKPPYFCCKTSVLCGKEVRCFRFSGWERRKIPLFPILRYFGTRQGVVASEALLSPLTTWSGEAGDIRKRTLENIAHSSGFPESKAFVFIFQSDFL